MSDIGHLLATLDRVVNDGNTVILIEHNLDVIRNADWVIDLGPEGGSRGGRVVFKETARELVGRSPAAVRQLASRARRKVRGAAPTPDSDLDRQREVVKAFRAASRKGDFDALVATLDPDAVVLRADGGAGRPGRSGVVRGAQRSQSACSQDSLCVYSADRSGL